MAKKREVNYGVYGGGQYMKKKLKTPYPQETVESFGGKYTQEEIDIAEAIFSWWISKDRYEKWYADTFQQQKMNFSDDTQ